MSLRCGIVGLPNVGKSTLFNALSGAGATAANYPFCTIDPNRGVVPVPDDRLARLAHLSGSKQSTPTTVEFIDIAGIVAGASRGEGLGNTFLSHIRQVDALIHVVRCFEEEDIAHTEGWVDPQRDIETIDTELLLKDLETVEKSQEKATKQAKSGDKKARVQVTFLDRLAQHLGSGRMGRSFAVLGEEERTWMESLFLLSSRPVLFAANVGEEDLPEGTTHAATVQVAAAQVGAPMVTVSAEFEAQLADMEVADKVEFLESAGIASPGLDRLVRAAYDLLGLITFFTTGPKETRAWTIRRGTGAREAAGRIHSDFERGFIRAETITCNELLRLGSENAARQQGAMRSEGRDYIVKDGDVLLFRFNV